MSTVMTSAISGRPARGLPNRFTQWGDSVGLPHPGYPMTYDAGKALIAAAKAAGETGYAAQWAGQGAPLSRNLPAAELVALLRSEEHTSELQSLMRNSYAVFCLTKKKYIKD